MSSPSLNEATVDTELQCLIATLGTEPQVVTLALQALVERQVRIDEVVVVHTITNDARITGALARLDDVFAQDQYLSRWQAHYHPVAIRDQARLVSDILAAEDLGAALDVLYRTVRDWKRAGYSIHLNLSGGRKLMSICAMTVAQLLFDEGDHLWYLQSSPELIASKALFAADNNQVTLVPVPLLRWSPAPPMMTNLALADNPVSALTWQHEQLALRKRSFLSDSLTGAEREVAELLIRSGATDAELAMQLHKSQRTIAHQLAAVYDKLRVFLGVREDIRVDRQTLIAEFSGIVSPNWQI